MKKLIIVIGLWLIGSGLWAQGWLQRYGKEIDKASAQNVARTNDGGFFISGYAKGSSSLFFLKTDAEGMVLTSRYYDLGTTILEEVKMTDAGDGTFIVAYATDNRANEKNVNLTKVNQDCQRIWTKSYGDASVEYLGDLKRLNDGNFALLITKSTASSDSAAILKTDARGDSIWYKSIIPLTNRRATALAESNDRSIYFTSRANGAGNDSTRLVKTDANGIFQSTKTIKGTGANDVLFTRVLSMTTTSDGGLAIIGNYFAKIDVDGNVLWHVPQRLVTFPNSFITTPDGGFALAVAFDDALAVRNLMFYKVAANGTIQIEKLIGKVDVLSANLIINFGIAQTVNGGYVIAAEESSASGSKARLMKIDADAKIYTGEISGNIFIDRNANCTEDGTDPKYSNVTIEVISRRDPSKVFRTRPFDSLGNFFVAVDTGLYDIRLTNIPENWAYCLDQTTNININTDFKVDRPRPIGLTPQYSCPQLEVNISTAYLQRCRTSTYKVRYCNSGPGKATNAYVTVTLDSLLNFVGASLPVASRQGRIFRFNLGDVETGQCGTFDLRASVACGDSTKEGQALCALARIYPDTFCVPAPNWNRGSLQLTGRCDLDSVRFLVANVGKADVLGKTGIVIEDIVVFLRQPTINIKPDSSIRFSLPKNGRTWRAQVQQQENHPGNSRPTVSVEGCGRDAQGNFTVGFTNQFAEDDADPFVDKDCQILRGGVVGTEKEAFPIGYQAKHLINPTDDIEYLIRFKNLTNDTVMTVVIRDTLSNFLEPSSLELGSSSHPYQFQIFGNNIVKFVLPELKLTSNATDSANSFGFVKFRAKLKKDVPTGTVIYNKASVSLNNGSVVETNTTFHTVGQNFILTAVSDRPLVKNVSVKVYPNPFNNHATFEIEGIEIQKGQFELYDLMGRKIRTETFYGKQFDFYREDLSSGLYVYKIDADGRPVISGKIMVKQ